MPTARRRCCAASGCSRTCSARRRRRRRRTCRRSKENEGGEAPTLGARADGAAPQEPGRAPAATRRWIRSASRSRTSTRSASGATQRGGHADRRVRRAARRHHVRRPGRVPEGAAEHSATTFVGDGHREAADLRARPRRRVSTTCRRSGRSCATPRPSDYRWSSLILGDRQEHAVSDADDAGARPTLRTRRTAERA